MQPRGPGGIELKLKKKRERERRTWVDMMRTNARPMWPFAPVMKMVGNELDMLTDRER